MVSLVVTATAQAVVIGAISNVLAQLLQAFNENVGYSDIDYHRMMLTPKSQKPLDFDVSTFTFFVIFSLISCPPNVLFQIQLEEAFPADKIDAQGRKRLSKSNTAKKFLLDQTVSATFNTVAYIAAIAAFRGKDGGEILHQIQTVRLANFFRRLTC